MLVEGDDERDEEQECVELENIPEVPYWSSFRRSTSKSKSSV